MIRVVNKVNEVVNSVKIVRSLQEISKNLSGNLNIQNSILWANTESQHRDIPVGISSHSLATKYLVICRILLKSNWVAFYNVSPKKKKSELNPAREENTLLTDHNQLSLTNK
jgi:hypothetical protein